MVICVFSDLLGFRALTQDLPRNLNLRWDWSDGLDFLGKQFRGKKFLGKEATFAQSQYTVEQYYSYQVLLTMFMNAISGKHPKFQTMFSDCAFSIYDEVTPAVVYAIGLIRRLISNEIPVRIGLARGNFIDRSYPSMRVGKTPPWPIHFAIFLGSAITRAAAAAEVPTKGLGIFLDNSVLKMVTKEFGETTLVPLSLGRETCWYQLDWFRLALPNDYLELGSFLEEERTLESWIEILSRMAKKAPQEDRVQAHYHETLSLLKRDEVKI